MTNYYRGASFLISASQASQFPENGMLEVAFAGRSNAGTLCDQKALARTSKTPGRTQLINFFPLDDQHCLVDLPGYGYAKVPERVRKEWQKLMEAYLGGRQQLRGLVVIMDIRHPLKDYDLQMLEWCEHMQTPAHILLTKADKLKKGQASKQLLMVKKALKDSNIEELQCVLDRWLRSE